MWMWLKMKQLRTVGPLSSEDRQQTIVWHPRISALSWVGHVHQIFFLKDLVYGPNQLGSQLTIVSCSFSQRKARRLAYAVAAGVCAIGVYAVHGILDKQALFGVMLGRTRGIFLGFIKEKW